MLLRGYLRRGWVKRAWKSGIRLAGPSGRGMVEVAARDAQGRVVLSLRAAFFLLPYPRTTSSTLES